jgi:subtilase family serine protease
MAGWARGRARRALLWAWPLLLLAPLVALAPQVTGRGFGSLAQALAFPPGSAPATGALPPTHGLTADGKYLFTPEEMRAAYNVTPLLRRGYTGAGQTVVVIESFGNPNLTSDVATFSTRYGLPPADIQVLAPLGAATIDPNDPNMSAWARETTLDVDIVHAIAPGARIVVLTSPVAENQGTSGLPEFLQLEQYAVDQRLGAIISQSWGASEVTLATDEARQELARWDTFFQQATTTQGVTFFAASGDHGVSNYADLAMSRWSTTATNSFPADDPWVTSVGGTTLTRSGDTFSETAWSGSGGGYSAFFPLPHYQLTLPAGTPPLTASGRGVPDVAASADRNAGIEYYVQGGWRVAWGTSASAPIWAALTAIANQMAGRPLGYLTPTLFELAATSAYTSDFHDITVGNNSFARGDVNVPGYTATPGWDPVTGLGAPNAERLLPDLITRITGHALS